MALGLILWVSWICFLLFDSSTGSPAIKGYGYPSKSDSRNIDYFDDYEVLNNDQSNWQAASYQPAGPVSTSYYKPAVAQQPALVPSQQNLPNTPSAPAVEKLVNGVQRDWGMANLHEPLVFPLSNPAQPQPGPIQPQTFSDGVASSQNAGHSTHYASPAAYNAPFSPSKATESPSSGSWQPVPDADGYGEVDFNAHTSGADANIPHLVYEDVFQYPAENPQTSESYGTDSNAGGYDAANYMSHGSSTGYSPTLGEPSFSSYPANAGAQPVYPSGQNVYQPSDEVFWHPQDPVSTQNVDIPQSVSEPIFPPAPPPSFITQTRNGYQRVKYVLSHSKYTPESAAPMLMGSKRAKGPAPQPAAPKGVKNPQRTKS